MRKKSAATQSKQQHFELKEIVPITDNQEKAFNAWDDGKNLFLYGWPGTGKSFISLYLALETMMEDKNIHKVIIVRSVVPGRDMGFLPGTIKEKSEIYEEPYKHIAEKLFHRGDAYDILRQKGQLEFVTTSFLRSITWENAIIILDESQNCIDQESHTVLSRIGEDCRVIICGDLTQVDLKKYEKSGIEKLMQVTQGMPSFSFVEFDIEDIVRSGFAKEYIIARVEYEKDFQLDRST